MLLLLVKCVVDVVVVVVHVGEGVIPKMLSGGGDEVGDADDHQQEEEWGTIGPFP